MLALKTSARVAALLIACCFGSSRAAAQATKQQPAPSPTAAPASSTEVDPESADIAITANVKARELRFDVVPNPRVVFTGRPERNTEWSSQRQALPQTVEPGVTYRDIGIQLKIVSVFADIDRIVAEALGEVPTSDANDVTPATDQLAARTNPTARQSAATAPRPSTPPANRRPTNRRKQR